MIGYIFLAVVVTVVRAGIIAPASTTLPAAAVVRTENFDPHPQYSFSYSVADGLTGTYALISINFLIGKTLNYSWNATSSLNINKKI